MDTHDWADSIPVGDIVKSDVGVLCRCKRCNLHVFFIYDANHELKPDRPYIESCDEEIIKQIHES